MIRTFVLTRTGRDPQAAKAQAAFAREGRPDAHVQVATLVKVEGDFNADAILPLIANPSAGESAALETQRPSLDGRAIVEVAYRPAVVDPETESGLEAAELMGVSGVEWLRMATRYIVQGVRQAEAERIVTKHLFNDVVQVIVGPDDYTRTLRPSGEPDAMQTFDLSPLSDAELLSLSGRMGWYAPLPQLRVLQQEQAKRGRPWTDVEIEMTVQSWGDHCYHTTWKGLGLLKELMAATRRIDHPLCVSIFVDNAGAMEFYEGFSVFIKGETHNHPSAISTKGGIETKHGGVLRDIIFMGRGGYPIGSSTIMGTRPPSELDERVPKGALHPRTIVLESIDGTSSYCNPMGVPMMYAQYRAHPGYAKCLALGHCIGIAPTEFATKETARKGDLLILLGGATGRDGVHGATASSADLTAEMVQKEGATVQIGHPIVERKFTTLIPILRDERLIRTCTDLGAGGISCCVGEVCAECGADVRLDGLPLKDASLASWEKWVSESQERGLIVVDPSDVARVLAYCERYGVQAFKLGVCRDDKRLIVTDHGETVVDMDLDFLWSACPIEPLEVAESKVGRKPVAPWSAQATMITADLVSSILGDYACCDQSFAVNRFDSTVQGRTVVGPLTRGVPSDAYVSAPIRGKPYGMVSACAFNPRWSDADPVGSVGALMCLAISRSIAAGASLSEITLCGNYYTPSRTKEQLYHLREMVLSAVRLSEAFGTPFISGKDSSSGTFKSADGQAIDVPPTFVPSTLCRMPDVTKVVRKAFQAGGHAIMVIRPPCKPNLAGSVATDYLGVKPEGDARLPWPEDERSIVALWGAFADSRRLLASAAAIGEGGALLQVVHGCITAGMGAHLSLTSAGALWDLLGEPPASFLVTTDAPDAVRDVFSAFECVALGEVTASPGLVIEIDGRTTVHPESWPALVQSWRSAFEREVLL